MHRPMARRSAAGVLALPLTIATLVAPATAAPEAGAAAGVVDTGDVLVVSGDTYDLRIVKEGFRFSFVDPAGVEIVPAHDESGIRLLPDGESDFVDAVDADLISDPHARTAVIDVALEDGSHITVQAHPSDSYARISVKNLPGGGGTIDFRTGPVAPAYGLGDHGSWADGSDEQGESCNSRVTARPTTELTGLVLEDVTNGGSCQRFISNFTIFPKQRFGQVLFEDGQKRVGLTDSENPSVPPVWTGSTACTTSSGLTSSRCTRTTSAPVRSMATTTHAPTPSSSAWDGRRSGRCAGTPISRR